MKKSHSLLWFLCLPFILDRITKFLAVKFSFDNFFVAPFLSLDLEFNRGVSWSLLHSEDCVTFCILSTVIFLITGALIWYTYNRYKLGYKVYGELLIISGAISNFIDRIIYGGVVDFISLHFKNFYWPTFNIADAGIMLGILIIVVMSLKNE